MVKEIEYYSAIKRRKSVFYDNMDKPGGHYAQWNKPETETLKLYALTYMEKWKGKPI